MLDLIVADLGPSLLFKLTDGTGDVEDIDLGADYSDDDKNIYFDKNTLVDYLDHIVEDNIFKISLQEDDE